jgi:hypothetical protein
MTIAYKQFSSDLGFKSPGFSVDENGNFTIANLNTTSSIAINGDTVIDTSSLGSGILSSSLTSVGTLNGLTVNSATPIGLTTTGALNLNADVGLLSANTLTVTSSGTIAIAAGTTGTIDNITIGETSPAAGTFTTLTATTELFVGTQNIKALSAALAVALS